MSLAIRQLVKAGVSAGCAVSIVASAPSVRAEDAPDPDRSAGFSEGSKYTIDRTWLYTDDARVPRPLVLLATTSASYTSVADSPSRIVNPFNGCSAPCNTYNSFAGNTATPGGVLSVGGELGLVSRLSLAASTQIGLGGSDNAPSPSAGAIAGLRFDVLPGSAPPVHLVVSGGYLREGWQGPVYNDDTKTWHGGSPNGDNGAWLQAAVSGDIGKFRLAGTLHVEHVFSVGRDPVDFMVEAGASYRAIGDFRVGLEYVGQDLEESFSPEAEGGARHILGPIGSLQLLRDRLTMVVGPAIGLSTHSPDFLGRFALSYAF